MIYFKVSLDFVSEKISTFSNGLRKADDNWFMYKVLLAACLKKYDLRLLPSQLICRFRLKSHIISRLSTKLPSNYYSLAHLFTLPQYPSSNSSVSLVGTEARRFPEAPQAITSRYRHDEDTEMQPSNCKKSLHLR